MPHSTADYQARSPNLATPFKFPDNMRTSMERFPDVRTSMDNFSDHNDTFEHLPDFPTASSPLKFNPQERWQVRRDDRKTSRAASGRGHTRQKSLSDAIRTIRTRKGSVSQNAQEIAEALKAPVSPKLIILCLVWYFSSALTNTSSKSILNAFRKPATLTLIQFAFVASYCLFFSWLSTVFPALKNAIPALRHGIRYPTRDVIKTTLPLAFFQIGGHLLSASATAKIPVSLVHTIKGLSPLFTVFAYRFLFDIRYPLATYLSLIPLTLGVMLACSAEFKGNLFGIFYAFLAAIIFVTQNIFSKHLFNEAAKAEADGRHFHSKKLDKLNLLFYSSGLAFLLTAPLWLWSEGFSLMSDFFEDGSVDLSHKKGAYDHGRLALEFVFNGTFHFGQNIIAFVLLSMTSPVTYSVASLIKRVFVVVIAIIWFQNPTTNIQAVGIGLTFFGLYLYDRTSESKKAADRKAKLLNITEEPLLPLNTRDRSFATEVFEKSPASAAYAPPYMNGYLKPLEVFDDKKSDDINGVVGRRSSPGHSDWLPPGTRQEETWRPTDAPLQGLRA